MAATPLDGAEQQALLGFLMENGEVLQLPELQGAEPAEKQQFVAVLKETVARQLKIKGNRASNTWALAHIPHHCDG